MLWKMVRQNSTVIAGNKPNCTAINTNQFNIPFSMNSQTPDY